MERNCGVLLHVSSLPNKYGIGTMGKEAYEFVDFLVESGHSYWQVLPLCQTGYGDSPYQSCSAFSGSPYFIDFDLLVKDKLLKASDFNKIDFGNDEERVNYAKQFNHRFDVLRIAYNNFKKTDKDFVKFLKKGDFYDYGMYMSLKYKFDQKPLSEWPKEFKMRDKTALGIYAEKNADDINFWQFVQFLFFKQWHELKKYANKKGVKLIGDMPIYVATDSVEVWIGKENFLLDSELNPTIVAGCPPDCFTEYGQLWGNPIYDWAYMKKQKFVWWKKRLEDAITLFDKVRIDHFRGFSRYYTIKSDMIDARIGEWKDCYGEEMFKLLEKQVKGLDIIAEDLGFIDKPARDMFDALGYPGMKICLFGFDGSIDNEHRPSNHTENFIAYTGTHDNETLISFIKTNINDEYIETVKQEMEHFKLDFIGDEVDELADSVIQLTYASKASIAVLQMQDLLKLDNEARMNLPSTLSTDNWSYKLQNNDYKKLSKTIKDYATKFGRIN